jgi:large subunit ribosomal protein L4e
MALARPLISVFNHANPKEVVGNHPLPGVFTAPIRLDIVHFVHSNLSKNTRQAHGVDPKAGMRHSAESWGTGRAVARIPRISGSGTSRNGQGAFGNMCRKGRMFAPLKTWRRWHRKVNLKQRRHAVASALAASALVPLVFARGHRIEHAPLIPLVVDDKLEGVEKTKEAVAFLKKVGVYNDVAKVIDSKTTRSGVGKSRSKHYKIRKGPLFVYHGESRKLAQAVRNIPGVEIVNVSRLNLRQLAPGGQIGRLIIWTQSAFKALDQIFGTYRVAAGGKSGYHLQRHLITNPDIAKIINSNEIQSVVRPKRHDNTPRTTGRKNPLRNRRALERLNPYAKTLHQIEKSAHEANHKKREEALKQKRTLTKEQKAEHKARRVASKKWLHGVQKNLDDAYPVDEPEEEVGGEVDQE